jgi:hypothetical protein
MHRQHTQPRPPPNALLSIPALLPPSTPTANMEKPPHGDGMNRRIAAMAEYASQN